jgi:hypothetical protein
MLVFMGLVNRCIMLSTDPFITTSMAMLGEKLGGGSVDHSVGLGVVLGALFFGSSRVCPMLLMACERLPRTWTTHRKHTWGIRGLA